MVTLTRKFLNSLITMCFFSLLVCAIMYLNGCSTPQFVKQQAVSKNKQEDKATYQEFEKDGRIYVFTSPTRRVDFEKSGELGIGIIKIGHGPNGETVVFDSDDAVSEYEKHRNIR